MGEVLGLGLTHYPGLMVPDEAMGSLVLRTIASGKVPAALRDPAAWPEAMRREWARDQGAAAAAGHRRRLVEGFRAVRKALDDFAPDFVVIFGDDQYENFREDMIPPFCVFAVPEMVSRPFARANAFFPGGNVWGEAKDKEFRALGHPAGAKHLIARLMAEGFDMAYAYTLRHEIGLAHAFINTLLYLDYDRQGFPYPVVPFHVNCYGSSIVRNRGGIGASGEAGGDAGGEAGGDAGGDAGADPPGPTAARCFALGAAAARALETSPWRVALIASSSWSHAFLTPRTGYLHPDIEADRARFAELRDGRLERWRDLAWHDIEAAGQHELLNWICLAGAMHALGRRAEIVDWVETYVFNSSKCFAVFPCS
jgi:hypothetical protein